MENLGLIREDVKLSRKDAKDLELWWDEYIIFPDDGEDSKDGE